MATQGKVKELAGELRKNLPKLSKPRVDLITLFIIAVSKVGSINLSKIALAMDNKCLKDSNYRRLQRFIKEVDIGKSGLILMILNLLGKHDPMTLLIDRTNWDFGKKKINILMISVLYKGYSIPLIWSLLNKKGNSNQGERWDLINKLIDKIGKAESKIS